ncbi:MAG: diaminopimelate decarboxylase, partial [Micromonosporaceae bacterium]|nr:diaminopimelate decarboxylase [Micromonosporaceae bacterium]
MRAHEAGALHGSLGTRGPDWLTTPTDVNELHTPLWPVTVARGDDGALVVGGVDVRSLAREFGTPAYILDEADFRARCRDYRTAF